MSSGDDLLNTLLNADDEDQATEPERLAPERRRQVAALRQAEVDEIRRLRAQRQRMEAEAEQLAAEQQHLTEDSAPPAGAESAAAATLPTATRAIPNRNPA